MILKTVEEDILDSDVKHIAVAVNIEGINDCEFAGRVIDYGWKELDNISERR